MELFRPNPNWRSYGRAILACVKKDLLLFVRYPLNAAFHIIQPLVWLTPIYFLGRSFASAQGNAGFAGYAGTSDYMSFILLGTLLSGYVSSVFWSMGFALKTDMDAGVLESNWMAPIPRILLLIGQTLASLLLTTVLNSILLLLAALLFGFHVSGDVLAA